MTYNSRKNMKVALIPARSGSKRLKNKNIMELAGKPLIQWTIEAALQSNIFDDVCVSTDSKKIADISRRSGASVPFLRPKDLATDFATTEDVIADFVRSYESNSNSRISYLCLLQPTSPLRSSKHICDANDLLLSEELDVVISVCEVNHPIELCNTLGEDFSMKGFVQRDKIKRTQDLEKHFRLNGAIYFCTRNMALNFSKVYDSDVCSRAYIMDAYSSIDIDSLFDFELAGFVMRNYS